MLGYIVTLSLTRQKRGLICETITYNHGEFSRVYESRPNEVTRPYIIIWITATS